MGSPGLPASNPTPSRTAQRSAYALFVLLVLAAGLRLYGIGDACYWLDEFYSLECSTGRGLAHAALPVNTVLANPPQLTTLADAPPWWHIWTSLDLDNHPPLYFLILRAWRTLVPDGEGYLRLPSALASLGAVAFLYFAVRKQLGPAGALAAAAVLAVASSQVHFAQELRGYAFWALFATIAAWALASIEHDGPSPPRVIALALATLAMLLTHYFAVAIAVGLGLYALFALRGRTRVLTVATLAVTPIVYAITWGPFLLRQRNTVTGNNLWQLDPGPHHFAHTLQRVALLPLRWLSETLVTRAGHGTAAIAVAIVTAALVAAAIWFFRRDRALWFWLAFSGPLVAMVAGIDLSRHARYLDVTRYTFVATPIVCALVGLVVARTRTRLRWLVPTAVVGLCLTTIRGAYSDLKEWTMVAGAIQTESQPNDVYVYASGGREPWWAGSGYLGISHYYPNTGHPVVLMTDPAAARDAVKQALTPGATVWVVTAKESVFPTTQFPGSKIIQTVGSPSIGRISQITLPTPTTQP